MDEDTVIEYLRLSYIWIPPELIEEPCPSLSQSLPTGYLVYQKTSTWYNTLHTLANDKDASPPSLRKFMGNATLGFHHLRLVRMDPPVRCDDEGNVILDSAQALLQGLYPPTSESRSRLANGTTVVGPFNGYQYIPSTYSKAQFSITCVLNIIIPLQLSPLSPSRVSSWKAGLIVLYAI